MCVASDVLSDSDISCLEARVRMVYCVAFYCNANNSKTKVI